MIEKRFLYFNTPAAFEAAKDNNEILDTSIVFVNGTPVAEDEDGQPIYDEDYPFIYTHGIKFAGGGGGGGSTVKPLKFTGTIYTFKSIDDFTDSTHYDNAAHNSYVSPLSNRLISVSTDTKNIAIAYPINTGITTTKPNASFKNSVGYSMDITQYLVEDTDYEITGALNPNHYDYKIYKYVPLMLPSGTITFTF